MNKKNVAELLKKHREKQKANTKANKKIKPLLGVEDRIKRKRKAVEKLKDKDKIKRIREFVNSKKSEIYRRNARKKYIKIQTKVLYDKESRAKLKRKADKELVDIIDDVVDGDTYLESETIPYAEPYRDTSKKDEIYRRKAKKNAIKILKKKKTKISSRQQQ